MIMTTPITIERSYTNNAQFSQPSYIDVLDRFSKQLDPLGININLYNGYTIGSLMDIKPSDDLKSYILTILADTRYLALLSRDNCRVGTICDWDEKTNELIDVIGLNFYYAHTMVYDLDLIATAKL